MRKQKVFLDSSVIIAALLSARGGSFFLLSQLRGYFLFEINQYVFTEVQEVLKTKFKAQPQLQNNFFLLLGLAEVKTTPNPARKEVKAAARLISKEDAPILASALGGSNYLVTLDNEFFKPLVIQAAEKKGLQILKPGDLIRKTER